MTIRELARALGLSKTTVADALRDKPVVNSATRKHVQDMAQKMGYKFNPVASAFLRQMRSPKAGAHRATIAWLVPTYGRPHAGNVGIQQVTLHQGMVDRAAELGYRVDIIDAGAYDSAQLTRMLVARGVLGVIAGPLLKAISHLTLDWSRFAAVAFGYSLTNPALHKVVPNHFQGINLAVKMCHRRGFRRIGLVLRNEAHRRSNGQWASGFWWSQRLLPDHRKVTPLLVADREYTMGRINDWIRREKPDAVIFHNRALAPAAPGLAGMLPGGAVPVVLDLLPTDTCAGIDQQYRLSGKHLVDVLAAQIMHNERGIPESPQLNLVAGKWVQPDGFGSA